MIDDIQTWLKGKKTYLTCIGGIVGLIVGFTEGQIELIPAIQQIVALMLVMTGRAAYEKK